MSQPHDERQKDLFRPALNEIIDMDHPLVRLAGAIEPVIRHIKAEHRMGRDYLKGRHGDRANAVLTAAGYNFSLLLRWLAELLRALVATLARTPQVAQPM
jgi:hypothetical protein